MSYNGSGTYVPPAGQPVATGTVIQSATFNTLVTDIGNTFNNVLPRDGQASMQGQLKITDGTSSIPGIAFNSEASSGIFRPGTGVLAFVASGVENLRINSAGRVMIGTTNDDGTNTLQVNGPAKVSGATTLTSTLNVTGATTLASTLNVTGATVLASTLGVTGATTLSSVTTSGAATVGTTLGVTGNATVGGTLGVTGAASLSSTLSVTGNSTFTGRALLGGATDDATTPLQVSSTGGSVLSLNTTNVNGSFLKLSNSGTVLGYLGSGKALTYTGVVSDLALRSETGAILFSQSGTEKARFDVSGNLRVGVNSSPPATSKLDVYGSSPELSLSNGTSAVGADIASLKLYSDSSNTSRWAGVKAVVPTGASGIDYTALAFVTNNGATNNAERMRIDPTGNVGIGTTAPGNKLHVIGNATLGATTAVAGAYQTLGFSAGIYNKAQIRGYSLSTIDAGALAFLTAPDGDILYERMRVDSTGNVGIGVTSPTAKLDIGGVATGTAQAVLTRGASDNNFQLTARNGSGNTAGSEHARFGMEYVGYGLGAGFSFLRGSSQIDSSLALMTNNTERARINSTGNLLLGATVDDGTASKLQVAGAVSLSGLRPTTINPATGVLNFKGDAGGWATGMRFQGSGGTQYGGFWGNGTGDTCGLYAIGDAYNSGWLTVLRSSGKVLLGTTTDNGTGAMLQMTALGGVSVDGGDTSYIMQTRNSTAGLPAQYYVKHNLGAVDIGNARGAINLVPYSGSNVNAQGGLSVSNNLWVTQPSYLNGASGGYTGNSSAVTVNYAGAGTQYGITMKPASSTGDSNVFNFLPSTATYASATTMASIQHRANDAGMNLSGSWALNGYAVLSSNQPTINKPTIKGYIEQLQNLNGASVTVDPTGGTLILITTSANTSITLPTPVDGMCFTLVISYGGVHTVTFTGGGSLRWAGGTVPAATSVANKIDKYVFTCASGITLGQDGGRNF